MSEKYFIIIFSSTHLALKAERIAKKAGIRISMTPVPREISSDCNMGIKISVEQEKFLRALLSTEGVECDFVKRVI
jgi:hypothetical protein